NASSPAVQKAHNILCKFVLIGWAIYPLGYMVGTGVSPEVLNDAGQAVGGNVPQWYSFLDGALAMDVIYNIGDAINKIGFGLVIYSLAVSDK
ncbi:MAG: bacteriorhodopsin, partial [Bacteroidota bacterium]|nr:bacteriorhodopsin [Bacteroidota bacterium]